MHDAKTQLSKLVREASSGEPFLIAKAGKPVVKVEKFEEHKTVKRLGFMLGEGNVTDDFNTIGSSEIECIFYKAK